MAYQAGFRERLYLKPENGTGTGTSSYVMITGTQDITGSDANESTKVSLREESYSRYLAGKADFSISFTLLYDPENAQFKQLERAYALASVNDFYVSVEWTDMDKALNPETYRGMDWDYIVSRFEIGAPVNGASTRNVTLQPSLASPRKTRVLTGLNAPTEGGGA